MGKDKRMVRLMRIDGCVRRTLQCGSIAMSPSKARVMLVFSAGNGIDMYRTIFTKARDNISPPSCHHEGQKGHH